MTAVAEAATAAAAVAAAAEATVVAAMEVGATAAEVGVLPANPVRCIHRGFRGCSMCFCLRSFVHAVQNKQILCLQRSHVFGYSVAVVDDQDRSQLVSEVSANARYSSPCLVGRIGPE